MRKKQVTHISCCKRWDRFYFANDSKKKVWQVLEHTAMDIRGEIRKVTICMDDQFKQEVFFSARVIIFLRSATRMNRTKPPTLWQNK